MTEQNAERAVDALAGRIENGVHILPVRIYYEDTDFSGIVYHANYLRYCERGRSDCLRLLGVGHRALYAPANPSARRGFVVQRMEIEFIEAARIDDVIEVRTRFVAMGGARFDLLQEIYRANDRLVEAQVRAVLVDGSGRPKRLPPDLTAAFAPMLDV